MSKRRRSSRKAQPSSGFWGPHETVTRPAAIRATPDPSAIPRSLGDPPLATNPAVSQRHLAAVYEEAVRTASALAAANGLLLVDSDDT